MKSILFALLLFLGVSISTNAEVPAPLAISLGTSTDAATKATYSITASGQANQNLQEIQFRIVAEGQTSVVTLRTGKHKTVGQVMALMGSVFKKFIEGQPANAVLGKMGNLKMGGEVQFVVASADALRFDFSYPDQPVVSSVFSRADATAFVALLGNK